jgi:drug/metabolite transporter (DMT)-like permease
MPRRPFLVFVVLSLLWGSEGMLAALLPQPPRLYSLAIQYGISAICLLPWAIRRHLWRRKLRSIAEAVLVGIGILCLPQVFFFIAGRSLAPAVSLVALALTPLFLAISNRFTIPLAICGFAGVLFLTDRNIHISTAQLPWLLLPLSAVGVLAWTLAIAERWMCDLSLAEVLFTQCAVSAVLLLIASYMLEAETVIWSPITAIAIAGQAILSVVCAYLLFYWLLRASGAARVSTLQWTQPLFAVAESAALMQMRPEWSEVGGAALIVIATMLAFSNWDRGRGVFFEITQT